MRHYYLFIFTFFIFQINGQDKLNVTKVSENPDDLPKTRIDLGGSLLARSAPIAFALGINVSYDVNEKIALDLGYSSSNVVNGYFMESATMHNTELGGTYYFWERMNPEKKTSVTLRETTSGNTRTIEVLNTKLPKLYRLGVRGGINNFSSQYNEEESVVGSFENPAYDPIINENIPPYFINSVTSARFTSAFVGFAYTSKQYAELNVERYGRIIHTSEVHYYIDLMASLASDIAYSRPQDGTTADRRLFGGRVGGKWRDNLGVKWLTWVLKAELGYLPSVSGPTNGEQYHYDGEWVHKPVYFLVELGFAIQF